MKSVFIERFGAPEVLTERDVERPIPSQNHVRIRVEAAGVNFADLLQRLKLYGNAPKIPYIPGFEVAGTISEVGPGVSSLQVGDRVVALTRFGGYAEEVCALAEATHPIPNSLDAVEAAAIPVTYLTAWFCLFEMAHLAPGEKVLIQTGAGGVGSAAVQLAKDAGAVVFATAGGPEKVSFLEKMGVDHPIDSRTEDFEKEIKRITGGGGLDVVLDAVGGETLRKGYDLLEPLGRLVSYGLSAAVSGTSRNWLKTGIAVWKTPRFQPLDMIGRNVGVFGFHLALLDKKASKIPPALAHIIQKTEAGVLKPVIAKTFPLDRDGAVAAHHFMHDRRNIGKVILERKT